jgi:protein SCO1/2
VIFEGDHGGRISFEEVFSGHPTIVVFFYTRCDNPLKCTLSITKLGRVQQLLKTRGLTGLIHTAAITYDPNYDLAGRMRSYGERRGLELGPTNRMLRTIEGAASLRSHFKPGVNFVESVVNRHRIEAYLLDERGAIAHCFERLQWHEAEVVERAAGLLECSRATDRPARAGATVGTLAAFGLAILPKCPACWALYLSTFGIAGLQQIPYPWIEPILAVCALINLASVWLRARSTGRWMGAWLVTAGAALIGLSRFGWPVAMWGVAATLLGSVVSALAVRQSQAA